MPPAPLTFDCLALLAPKINGGEMLLGFHTRQGPLLLRAPLAVMRAFAGSVYGSLNTPEPVKGGPAKPGRRDGRCLAPDVRAAYTAAHFDWLGGGGSRRDIAARHGLDAGPWVRWCQYHQAALRVAHAAQRKPITKPGGKLL
jgi:hypothetical protein